MRTIKRILTKNKVTFRNVFLNLQILLDWMRGVDFSIPVYHKEENHVQSMSSTPLIAGILKRFLRSEHITPDDAIIDVGCGKGRMVYFFSKFPFGQVAGLEYSQEVYETAKKNMVRLGNRGGILLIQGDAKFFSDYDKYNYFYLFNPFHGDIMEGFLNNLKESIARKNRRVTIIYFNPRDADILENVGFTRTQSLKHRIEIYRYEG